MVCYFSNILENNGNMLIGRQFEMHSGSPFLKIGVTSALLRSLGNMPFDKHKEVSKFWQDGFICAFY